MKKRKAIESLARNAMQTAEGFAIPVSILASAASDEGSFSAEEREVLARAAGDLARAGTALLHVAGALRSKMEREDAEAKAAKSLEGVTVPDHLPETL